MQINVHKLKNEIAQRYLIEDMGAWSQIINGDECLVWHIENGSLPLVVRVSPAWRTIDEIQWVYEFTAHCGQTIPEVVSPITALDNSKVFLFASYPVSVFPFVQGYTLNVDNAKLREKAARLLARIHNTSIGWDKKRPASKDTRPQTLPRDRYPAVFCDAEFDAWVESLPQQGLTMSAVHGDYYSRNVLATDTHITGVIDWDEAHITYLMAETGWSTWEFCQNDAGDDLNLDMAHDFLNAYFDETSPSPHSEIDHAINFIRLRLRNEAVGDLARKERCEAWDKDYTEAEMRAFVNLKEKRL